MPLISNGKKSCSKCSAVQPASAFNRHPSTGDRLQSWCKNCMRKAAKIAYAKRRVPVVGAKDTALSRPSEGMDITLRRYANMCTAISACIHTVLAEYEGIKTESA